MPLKLDLFQRQRFHKSLQHRSYYPIISNVVGSPGGTITWTTDIPSTSQVLYGLVPYLGFSSPYNGTLVTNHSVVLSPLVNGIRYYFRVQSFYWDSLSISDLYSFVFNAAAAGDILMEDGTYILMEDGTKIQRESA